MLAAYSPLPALVWLFTVVERLTKLDAKADVLRFILNGLLLGRSCSGSFSTLWLLWLLWLLKPLSVNFLLLWGLFGTYTGEVTKFPGLRAGSARLPVSTRPSTKSLGK